MNQVEDPRFATPPNEEQHAAEYHEPPPKEGRGCLFWGCLISGILFLLLIVGVPLALYFTARHYVYKFTVEEGAEIAVAELPEQQLAELSARIAAFGEAVKAGNPPPDLTLTAEEINGLIAEDESMRGRVLIRVAEGQVGGDLSIPADSFPAGKGRFFNVSADFEIAMRNGRLDVRLKDANLNGVALPQQVLDALASENLAKDVQDDPEVAEVLELFDSLEVVGDKIILKAKRPTEGNPPAGVDPAIESVDEAADPEPVGVGG